MSRHQMKCLTRSRVFSISWNLAPLLPSWTDAHAEPHFLLMLRFPLLFLPSFIPYISFRFLHSTERIPSSQQFLSESLSSNIFSFINKSLKNSPPGYIGTVVSPTASQQEGFGCKSGPETFLCIVCMFYLCPGGFYPGSYHSTKAYVRLTQSATFFSDVYVSENFCGLYGPPEKLSSRSWFHPALPNDSRSWLQRNPPKPSFTKERFKYVSLPHVPLFKISRVMTSSQFCMSDIDLVKSFSSPLGFS